MRDISASVLAISTPTVPAPTSTNVSSFCILRRRSLGHLKYSELLSLFKCQQHLCADAVGVAQRYQAGRNPRPLVVSKVVILNAGGENKEIVWYVVLFKANNALLYIDAGHFAQENVDVVLAAEYGPERTRNFVCRK